VPVSDPERSAPSLWTEKLAEEKVGKKTKKQMKYASFHKSMSWAGCATSPSQHDKQYKIQITNVYSIPK
jgi:hypothetical protein